MAIEKTLGKYALIGLAVIALAKPLAEQAGKLGASIGGAFESGISQFVSGITGLGGSGGGQTMQQDMQSMMGMPKVIIGNVDTTGGKGLPDFMGSKPIDPTAGKPFDIMGGGSLLGDMPLAGDTVFRFISNLETAIKSSPADVTLTTGSINDIFTNAYKFLQQGGSDIAKFAQSYKFPSGQTLEEILGGGVKDITTRPIIPEAFGQTGMSPQMMMAANLNIDKKIDTPAGVITYGSAKGSIGAGAGAILPAHTLTQIIQENPKLTASQAADLLFREQQAKMPVNFDFGSNTGSGLISMFMPAAMIGGTPRVISAEINPVLRAYEYYKAMYGLM